MRLLPLACLLACQQEAGFIKPEPEDTAEDTGGSGGDDSEVIDTTDTDGDEDDDGYTPQEGDCDDTDPRTAPGRDEERNDDVDNDCDGLVDEEWSGFTWSWITDAGEAWLQQIDTLGELGEETSVDGCYPLGLDRWGDGYATTDGYSVYSLSADGTCTELADFSEGDYGVLAVGTAADQGSVYASIGNGLYRVGADGTSSALAEWLEINEEGTETFFPVAVAVDPTSGAVGLFDMVGGFGTWTESGGLVQDKMGPYDAPTWSILAGGVRPGDGWYAIAQDASTWEYALLHWDADAVDWVESDRWESDWTPSGMALDGDHGDFYLTANGAWTPGVFRVIEGGDYVTNLYVAAATEYQSFYGIVANYTHD